MKTAMARFVQLFYILLKPTGHYCDQIWWLIELLLDSF